MIYINLTTYTKKWQGITELMQEKK